MDDTGQLIVIANSVASSASLAEAWVWAAWLSQTVPHW